MRLSQRYSCLHEVWRGNLILKILSYEKPSSIWELNYRAQLWGANKFTGKMVLILQREEWISLFGHGTFQCYVFMLSTWFVRTWRNGLFHKTWRHLLFAQQLEANLMLGLWWTSLKLIVITFARGVRAVIVSGVLAIWAHKHAGKHMVSANNSSVQFSNSRAVFESPYL